MHDWHSGGMDHARIHGEYHHQKAEIQQRQDELDQHHNIAQAEAEGEQKRSWFVIRVIQRLLGRR